MPVESFDFDKPEFVPPGLTPKSVGGNPGRGGGAEAFHDDDIPEMPGSSTSIGTVERPSAPKPYVIPKVGGVVTPLRANPTDRLNARSEDVQTPRPLTRPQEKTAAELPGDELAEIAADLPKVDSRALPDKDPVHAPPAATKEAAKPVPQESLFATARATPRRIDQAMIDCYGIEWLEWTPETLFTTVRLDFGTQIARVNLDKLQAAALLHLSDSFWQHWEVFEKVTVAFNNVIPLFDRVQEPTVGQMIHAVREAGEIRREAYLPEVISYIAVRAREEGFLYLPPPLDFAQARLDELNPPESKLIQREVRERWEAFHGADLRGVEFKEDLYGIQLAKLAACDLYLASVEEDDE